MTVKLPEQNDEPTPNEGMYGAENGSENAEITVKVLPEATLLGHDLQRAVC